jgi:hypothetical protein
LLWSTLNHKWQLDLRQHKVEHIIILDRSSYNVFSKDSLKIVSNFSDFHLFSAREKSWQMNDYVINYFRKVLFSFPVWNVVCWIFSCSCLWVVSHHLATSAEVRSLCHVHFADGFEINYNHIFGLQCMGQNVRICEHRRKVLKQQNWIFVIQLLSSCHLHSTPQYFQSAPVSRVFAPQ